MLPTEHSSAQQAPQPRFKSALKPLLRLLGLFDPLLREMVEMHYLISSPLILDDSALQGLIGPIAKTSYAEGVRRTLQAAHNARQP
ncbi:hypothetical protein [Pseudomonas sp. LD120]|uniref:hypothetical protein n=1 Tax=Pseudomonas sp. LD120 TaxID=485751 RepID=UPI0021140391|nr:hypothetical protein [Pseudomonas sp. LD120]